MQTDLFFHKSYSMPAQANVLFEYVEHHFSDHAVHLVYEAGCCGFHTARCFLNLGWNVLVINPADIRRSDKDRYQKTDKIDARNLSNQLKLGVLKSVYIPTAEQEQLLSLARHRSQLTRKLRQCKSHIKSMLLFHGKVIPQQFDNSNWTHDFLDWLRNIEFENPMGTYSLRSKIQLFEFVKQSYLESANQNLDLKIHFQGQETILLSSSPKSLGTRKKEIQ